MAHRLSEHTYVYFLCYRNTRAACGPQTAGWITLEDKCQGSTHSEPSSDSWGGEEPVKSSGTVSACLFLSIRPFQGCIQKNLGLTWIPLLRAGNRQTYHLQEQGHRRGSCLHWRYFHLEEKKVEVHRVVNTLWEPRVY